MSDTVTAHYYVSLCFHGLKRLGFAGAESTSEDQSMAQELAEMGEAFSFSPPLAGGPIFTLVYQIPGYLNPQDTEEMLRIFDGVGDLVKSGSIQHLQREFPERTAEWEKWFTRPWLNSICDPLKEQQTEVCQLIHRFAAYLEQLWPRFNTQYSHWYEEFISDQWSSQLQVAEVIDTWEQVLGISYPYRQFSLVVCPESPTLASSLGPEKVVFGQRRGIHLAERSLVHEVGVRMQGLHRVAEHPATAQTMVDDYLGILRLIEAEACFQKPQVMDELGLEYDADADRLLHGMQLAELVHMRAEICEMDSFPSTLARWYSRAKQEQLL